MITDCVKKSIWETRNIWPFWNNWLIFNVLSGIFLPLLIMNGLNTYSSIALNNLFGFDKIDNNNEQKPGFK
jgi:hypothetical protein